MVGDSDSVIHAFAMMAGVKRQSTRSEFRGGDANAIMGGVELDLRNAQIREGDDVIIDAFAMWGGVEITGPDELARGRRRPPDHGRRSRTTRTRPPSPARPLTIRGTAIMGAIEVKN